jgi:hypothetical protein
VCAGGRGRGTEISTYQQLITETEDDIIRVTNTFQT